ncbi:MAG: TIGR03905 family TSCPD domain-containing protein [Victivallales bacterium]|nr:TIGR03905 family TSCPD domain-containing protein [Victivallales bacterium]
MQKIHYDCVGTCSSCIDLVIDDDDRIVKAEFTDGCNGNLQGIAHLVQGMKCDEVISRLKGISCNGGPTSCPDQLAHALEERKAKN